MLSYLRAIRVDWITNGLNRIGWISLALKHACFFWNFMQMYIICISNIHSSWFIIAQAFIIEREKFRSVKRLEKFIRKNFDQFTLNEKILLLCFHTTALSSQNIEIIVSNCRYSADLIEALEICLVHFLGNAIFCVVAWTLT